MPVGYSYPLFRGWSPHKMIDLASIFFQNFPFSRMMGKQKPHLMMACNLYAKESLSTPDGYYTSFSQAAPPKGSTQPPEVASFTREYAWETLAWGTLLIQKILRSNLKSFYTCWTLTLLIPMAHLPASDSEATKIQAIKHIFCIVLKVSHLISHLVLADLVTQMVLSLVSSRWGNSCEMSPYKQGREWWWKEVRTPAPGLY